MSGWYRYGKPGEDTVVHLNTGRRSSGAKCCMGALPGDDLSLGHMCGRMSVALCDAPRCDKPICELHRVRHESKPNTDFCSEHADLAAK